MKSSAQTKTGRERLTNFAKNSLKDLGFKKESVTSTLASTILKMRRGDTRIALRIAASGDKPYVRTVSTRAQVRAFVNLTRRKGLWPEKVYEEGYVLEVQDPHTRSWHPVSNLDSRPNPCDFEKNLQKYRKIDARMSAQIQYRTIEICN